MGKLSRIVDALALKLATRRNDVETEPANSPLMKDFIARCRAMDKPRVLELGTKRSLPTRSTRHDDWVPNAGEYLGADIEAGVDVDVIADVHRLSQSLGEEQFDIIISCSTFEHFKYPHLAAHEIMKTMRVGALIFIQTHQAFPLHGYPYDYFRFSREAMSGLFGTRMGFKVIATDYEFPVRLYARRVLNAARVASYLNVRLWGEKTAKTPERYIYELDTQL